MTQMTATIIAVYVMTFFTVGISQRIIRPQLYHNGEYQHLCPGEEVNITCEIRGPVISWFSDEYIGPFHERLDFTIFHSLSTTLISLVNLNTVATLISINTTKYSMVSQLHIIAQSKFLNSYVNCMDNVTGIIIAIRIQVLGM